MSLALGILRAKLGAGHIHVAEARLGLKDRVGAVGDLKKALGEKHKATVEIAAWIKSLAGR